MISIPSTFKISLRALRVNKMRSALTMLGIIIGVGAVITMLAVGTGRQRADLASRCPAWGAICSWSCPGARPAAGLEAAQGRNADPDRRTMRRRSRQKFPG